MLVCSIQGERSLQSLISTMVNCPHTPWPFSGGALLISYHSFAVPVVQPIMMVSWSLKVSHSTTLVGSLGSNLLPWVYQFQRWSGLCHWVSRTCFAFWGCKCRACVTGRPSLWVAQNHHNQLTDNIWLESWRKFGSWPFWWVSSNRALPSCGLGGFARLVNPVSLARWSSNHCDCHPATWTLTSCGLSGYVLNHENQSIFLVSFSIQRVKAKVLTGSPVMCGNGWYCSYHQSSMFMAFTLLTLEQMIEPLSSSWLTLGEEYGAALGRVRWLQKTGGTSYIGMCPCSNYYLIFWVSLSCCSWCGPACTLGW